MHVNYQAFLLRLQRQQHANHWRATLENAHTGELLQFATEKELLLHLYKILDQQKDQTDTDEQSE